MLQLFMFQIMCSVVTVTIEHLAGLLWAHPKSIVVSSSDMVCSFFFEVLLPFTKKKEVCSDLKG